MNPNEQGWIPYAFAAIQTAIVGIVGYIARLLRDNRHDIETMKIGVTKHDVQIEEQEKREKMRAEETDRRLSHLEERRRRDE